MARPVQVYTERLIRNESELLDFIEALDEDEGIRIDGNLENHENGGFIFIGYYRSSYCVNICDKVWNAGLRKYLAGAKDEWYYFDTARQAFDFVTRQSKEPLRAWLY